MKTRALVLALALALALSLPGGAAVAQHQSLGEITGYTRSQLRLYDGEGRLVDTVSSRDLPDRPTIVALRPGGGLGIVLDGEVVYVRGIDVDFELNDRANAQCAGAAGATRAEGQLSTGTYAGGGSSRDCRLGGGAP